MRVPPEHGKPDGLAVDAEGFIWSANWQGGCVIRYAPGGSVASVIRVPAPCPTSCTFGGVALDMLYVTTAQVAASAVSHMAKEEILALPGLGIGRPDFGFRG